jgi:hypothetical protein
MKTLKIFLLQKIKKTKYYLANYQISKYFNNKCKNKSINLKIYIFHNCHHQKKYETVYLVIFDIYLIKNAVLLFLYHN